MTGIVPFSCCYTLLLALLFAEIHFTIECKTMITILRLTCFASLTLMSANTTQVILLELFSSHLPYIGIARLLLLVSSIEKHNYCFVSH